MALTVLHVITGLDDGGAEGVLTRLCLSSRNAHNVVISLTDEGKYGAVLRKHGVEVYAIGMKRGFLNFGRIFQLISTIRSVNPDLVQTWMYHADLIGGLTAKLAGVRRVFWGIRHTTLEKGKAKRLTIIIARICALLSYLLPEKIICCANKAKEVHEALGYCSKKLMVIPNGYDLSKLKPDGNDRAKIRREFNLTEDMLLFGMVGRFAPQKDHANLLRALSSVSENGYSFRCLLVGSGLTIENFSLINQAKQLGIQHKLIFAGPRLDIPNIMNALDVHILSSCSGEGFPNVLAEAMACGTPCAATDVGDAAEIIGSTGIVCRPGSPDELAESIQALIFDKCYRPKDWVDRKMQCRERISRFYALERIVECYESAWSSVK